MMKSVMEDYEPFLLLTINQRGVNTLMGVFSNCSLMPGSEGAGQQDSEVGWGWAWEWEQILPCAALSLLLASLLVAKHFSQAFRVAFVLFLSLKTCQGNAVLTC